MLKQRICVMASIVLIIGVFIMRGCAYRTIDENPKETDYNENYGELIVGGKEDEKYICDAYKIRELEIDFN